MSLLFLPIASMNRRPSYLRSPQPEKQKESSSPSPPDMLGGNGGMKRNLLCLTAIILLLTGCWDQRELSDISIITGMAIDKGEKGRYKLTIEGINATELNVKQQEEILRLLCIL